MEHDALERMRRAHPGWRLLTARNAPLVVSFLHRTFVDPNTRILPQTAAVSRLDDYIHYLRQTTSSDEYTRSPAEYLDDWASDECAWLRKSYVPGSDEPHFELSPTAEGAIEWLSRLGQRHFVGTESRLMTVLQLLKEIVQGTDPDPQSRIADLERRCRQLEIELARARAGDVELMPPTQVKERFLQMADTARALLSDFGLVEQNFRELHQRMRERIATWEGGKGALVAEIFGDSDVISDSDQGRSFRAFWTFLMAPDRQEELSELLDRVLGLDAVQELKPDRRLLRIHFDWLVAGEKTQRTVARLSEQLRRFLDDRTFQENRRILELLRRLEQQAVAVRDCPPPGNAFAYLDEPAPSIDLPFDRPLFKPPFKPHIKSRALVEGDHATVSTDALGELVWVDPERLRACIRRELQSAESVTLLELVERYPLEQGLAELIAYVNIAAEEEAAEIDGEAQISVCWEGADGVMRRATLPSVVFRR